MSQSRVICALPILMMAWASHPMAEVYVNGTVVYPNGDPAQGATVTATTACDSRVHFVVEATTDEHGSFTVAAPNAACRKLQFQAAKEQELWLQSGEWLDVLEENGTTPTIDLVDNSGERVEIRLGVQGGEVSLRLVEESSGRIYAGRMLIQRCEPGHTPGFSITSTTESEQPIWKVLVPAGYYCVGLMAVTADGDLRYPASPECLPIQVVAGGRQTVTLPFDAEQLRPKWSFFELDCPDVSGQRK